MTKVCIETQGDGTFSVYDADANQQNNEGDVIGAETPPTVAATIDEALEAARALLGGESQPPEQAEDAAGALQSGFVRGRGIPL